MSTILVKLSVRATCNYEGRHARPDVRAVQTHAVRRWCSADRSQLHEQTKAGGVGESLEPGGGGAVWPLKSEVARGDGMAPGSTNAERTLLLSTVRTAFAQTSTKKQSLSTNTLIQGERRTMSEQQLDQITLKAGTLIHFHGLPFRLAADTVVEGRKSNFYAATENAPELVDAQGRFVPTTGRVLR